MRLLHRRNIYSNKLSAQLYHQAPMVPHQIFGKRAAIRDNILTAKSKLRFTVNIAKRALWFNTKVNATIYRG